MNKQMDQVIEFNTELLGIKKRNIGFQDVDEYQLSLHQLREEIDEFELAVNHGNIINAIDALIDLEYFLYGVFWKLGVDEKLHERIFDVVHSANMLKKMGTKETRKGYGKAADAIKPNDWVSPEIKIARMIDEETKHNR